ncbi:MAG TPA: alternative ribosome rescue aminoacyl-tRNA hydrolase ArfB [Candidatus Polarisedimenticolaceae bacterium]|nr:alternative ribosome rescue aminoacyl-tRNA hydrolase ArfB [Candidatus Polarisedimenticolaceae bacterium]
MPIFVNDELTIPDEALTFTASRSGGPGGQHVNKTSSRVTLRVDLAHGTFVSEEQRARLLEKLRTRIAADGTLRVVAQTSRSQFANRRAAEARLAVLFAEALAPEIPRVETKVPRRSKANRLDVKRKRSVVKRLRGKATEE